MIPIIPSDANGLDEESFLICIEPMTFNKRRLVKYIGQVEDNQIEQFKFILRQ